MTVKTSHSGEAGGHGGPVAGSRKVTRFRWVILALVCFIYMLVAADRANLGVALPAIRGEFRISNAEAGLFASLMFFCFAAAQIPSSMLVRRFGARHLMLGALATAASASYLIGTSGSTLDIKVYRSLLGVAEAIISVCCMTTINHWFSVRDRGTATGFYWGASKLGPVLCPPIAVLILQMHGWRAIFQIFAVPVLGAALIWFFFVKGRPEDSRFVSPAELDQIRDSRTASEAKTASERLGRVPGWIDRLIRLRTVEQIDSVAGVFRSWNLIGNACATIFMVGIFNVFLAWIPSYLLNARHFPLATAGVLASALFGGAVAGNLAGGWLSDNVLGLRRKPLMMFGALFTAAALALLIHAPADPFLVGGLLVATGFVVGLGYPHFSIYPMSLTTREIYPVAYGALNTGAALGAACFPFAAGAILDAYSWNELFLFLSLSSLVCLGFLATIAEPVIADR